MPTFLLDPRSWPWLLLAAAMVWGGIELFNVKSLDAKIAALTAANATALAQQAATDAAASAQAQADLQRKLDAATKAANDAQEKLRNAPKTNTCGPSVRDADAAARGMLNGSSNSNPGSR